MAASLTQEATRMSKSSWSSIIHRIVLPVHNLISIISPVLAYCGMPEPLIA
ncbi:MAG: hypothetical protein RL442_444 [Pseudomonadota bacterium]